MDTCFLLPACWHWRSGWVTAWVGVHNVHTWGFGFGCTGFRLGRIGDVFGGGAVFQGLAPGSSPTSGTVFSPLRGFYPLSVHILFTCRPPSGPFFIAGRCGRGPPSTLGETVCRSLPVHGRSWLCQHDLAKIWCEFLWRIVGCSPGSSLAAVAGCSSSTWWVRGRAA